MKRILLEVCVTSVEDAQTAEYGGVDRVELNCALPLGGLTPTPNLLAEVKRHCRLPVMVMVRPRSGGFCYSTYDFTVMLRDAEAMLANGADGLVFGVLTAQGELDIERCKILREICGEKEAVFHRAFDVVPNPTQTLEQLIDLGFKRVMTSGQQQSTYNGTALVAQIIRQAASRIEILPAGGINRTNVLDILKRTGCDQLHASMRIMHGDPSVLANPTLRFGSLLTPESEFDGTDLAAIRALRELLRQHFAQTEDQSTTLADADVS